MICKVSISVTAKQANSEASATCELTCHGDGGLAVSAAQLQAIHDTCLAAASAEVGFAVNRAANRLHVPAKATPTLCQLARLYRVATKVVSFDLTKLQGLCHRLYHKPLEELSMLEVGGMIGTLNAVVKGLVDWKHVVGEPAPATNGRANRAVV